MSVVIFGDGSVSQKFSTILVEHENERLVCDGCILPFDVIGDYTISMDDSLAYTPPIKKVPNYERAENNRKVVVAAKISRLERKYKKQVQDEDFGAFKTLEEINQLKAREGL
jgi:hypothetical protein